MHNSQKTDAPTKASAPAQPSTEPGPRPAERPRDEAALRQWIADYTGIRIPDKPVCPGHQTPWDCFRTIHLDRPSVALILGSRGSGKSFLSALDTHLTSRWNASHGTRILGGSKAQSEQIYRALRDITTIRSGGSGNDAASIARFRKDGATYVNGSEVAILAASSTSVRGPHVASLKLDEVDEIDTDLRESAMGMCMALSSGRAGEGDPTRASVLMTSTCHRINGPMAQLIEQASQGDFPLFTMCAFEVLERCPEARSGPNLELCPACPIFRFCHEITDGGPPKAKRSNGHYPIDSLIQKVRTTGKRTFEADYLCKLSGSDSAWFTGFDPERHVSLAAEYRPGHRVHLAVDSGVFTGAVFFQIIPDFQDGASVDVIHVFGDYLAENRPAEANARAIVQVSENLCLGRRDQGTTDPAGHSRTAIGPTVLGEYQRAGLMLKPWPLGKVSDGLALLESFIQPAGPGVQFRVHPRCASTIQALQNYRRAKKAGQYLDHPADPQHPYEDLVDALRGGLKAAYPDGRNPQPTYRRVSASKAL